MATKPINPIDAEWEEAKSRYDMKMENALDDSLASGMDANVAKRQIIDYARANRDEKSWYRAKRGIGKKAGELYDKVSSTTGSDVADLIQYGPRKVYETATVPGIASKSLGETVSKIMPSSDEPLYKGEALKSLNEKIRGVAGDVVAGGVKPFLELPSALSTPKNIGLLGATVAAPAAAVGFIPDLALGGWEQAVGGIRSAISGDYPKAAEAAGGLVITAATLKAIKTHATRRAQREIVKRDVEAGKARERNDAAFEVSMRDQAAQAKPSRPIRLSELSTMQGIRLEVL